MDGILEPMTHNVKYSGFRLVSSISEYIQSIKGLCQIFSQMKFSNEVILCACCEIEGALLHIRLYRPHLHNRPSVAVFIEFEGF